jgi:hypothetical protein
MAGGALLVASSLWFGHKHEVKNAYKRGEAVTLAKWEEADRVAQAVGKETSRLLVKSRDVIQEKLDGKLQTARKIASNNAIELSRVRSALDELSAAQAGGDNSCPSGGGDGERIRVVLPILAEGPDLVQEAHGLLERCTARLTALQEWSLTVRAANPE